jgi:hypothetical protein
MKALMSEHLDDMFFCNGKYAWEYLHASEQATIPWEQSSLGATISTRLKVLVKITAYLERSTYNLSNYLVMSLTSVNIAPLTPGLDLLVPGFLSHIQITKQMVIITRMFLKL